METQKPSVGGQHVGLFVNHATAVGLRAWLLTTESLQGLFCTLILTEQFFSRQYSGFRSIRQLLICTEHY
jgi:hypothetical protein